MFNYSFNCKIWRNAISMYWKYSNRDSDFSTIQVKSTPVGRWVQRREINTYYMLHTKPEGHSR